MCSTYRKLICEATQPGKHCKLELGQWSWAVNYVALALLPWKWVSISVLIRTQVFRYQEIQAQVVVCCGCASGCCGMCVLQWSACRC